MKRINILWLLLNSLFLIVFNIVFFLLIDVCAEESKIPNSVWISYGFIHFAYFLFLATPLLVRKGSRSEDYDKPLYVVTSSYFIVELIAGVTLILVVPETAKATIIIQVILAAAFIAWLLIYLIANEHTADNAERHEAELQYVKESSAKLQSLLSQITDKKAIEKIQRVYDLIHSSPVRSNSSVSSLEQHITSEIDNLSNTIANLETEQVITLSDKIYRLAEGRNTQLKATNR